MKILIVNDYYFISFPLDSRILFYLKNKSNSVLFLFVLLQNASKWNWPWCISGLVDIKMHWIILPRMAKDVNAILSVKMLAQMLATAILTERPSDITWTQYRYLQRKSKRFFFSSNFYYKRKDESETLWAQSVLWKVWKKLDIQRSAKSYIQCIFNLNFNGGNCFICLQLSIDFYSLLLSFKWTSIFYCNFMQSIIIILCLYDFHLSKKWLLIRGSEKRFTKKKEKLNWNLHSPLWF